MSNKTFNDASPESLVTTTEKGGELFVFVGATGEEDFGGAALLIQKRSADGTKLVTLKSISSVASASDRASRFILPPNQIVEASLSGASAASLYVEFQIGERVNP